MTSADGKGLQGAVPKTILDFDALFPLGLSEHATLEAQCAAIADDIAYNTHDIDDGIRSGLLNLGMLESLALPGSLLRQVRALYPALDAVRTGHELMRRQITAFVEDVIAHSAAAITQLNPLSADDVRRCGRPLWRFHRKCAHRKRTEGVPVCQSLPAPGRGAGAQGVRTRSSVTCSACISPIRAPCPKAGVKAWTPLPMWSRPPCC